MSTADQSFVSSLGLSVSRVADAIGKSRQTVSRGIYTPGSGDYFKAPDLAKALAKWRVTDESLYALAKQKVCDFYPDVAQAVLAAAEASTGLQFSTAAPGEYWFVSGDFVDFKNKLAACFEQLGTLCAAPAAQVKLFVSGRDRQSLIAAQRLQARSRPDTTLVIPCEVELGGMPSTLLHIDDDGTMDLYGVSDNGFIPLSRQEAGRLRLFVQNVLNAGDVQNALGVDNAKAVLNGNDAQ